MHRIHPPRYVFPPPRTWSLQFPLPVTGWTMTVIKLHVWRSDLQQLPFRAETVGGPDDVRISQVPMYVFPGNYYFNNIQCDLRKKTNKKINSQCIDTIITAAGNTFGNISHVLQLS